MADIAIKIENLRKQYKLGAIGGGTLRSELQSWWARKRGKEDPNMQIGQDCSNFGETFWALDGINLEIKKGEALGIIGANGAGKSTLLKILSRVTAPTEGDIWINGRIASMLEVGTGFHGEMTGRENIYMNGAILGMSKKEVDEKIESIIDFSECRQFIDTPVKRYSSGMYVKLAFAVASHLDAEIMVMDEVLAVGDMKFQKKCLGRMGDEAKGGKTVLYVSHNMATIRNLCSRCIVLDKGKIIFDGDVEKAIGVYMETSRGELKSFIDFSNNKRSLPIFGKKIRLNSFEFLEKSTPRYFPTEDLRFKINWNSFENAGELRARIEIHFADSTPVGMAETKVFAKDYAVMENDNETIFSFPLKNLTGGLYWFRFSIFVLGDSRYHVALDDGGQHIWFEVEDFLQDQTRWLRQYWGSVRFDDIVCVKKEEIGNAMVKFCCSKRIKENSKV